MKFLPAIIPADVAPLIPVPPRTERDWLVLSVPFAIVLIILVLFLRRRGKSVSK